MVEKKDTLHFVLEGKNDGEIGYNLDEITEQVVNQRSNFCEKYHYYPEYINISAALYIFLQKEATKNTTYAIGDIKSVYGMRITTRSDEVVEALSDREAICLK